MAEQPAETDPHVRVDEANHNQMSDLKPYSEPKQLFEVVRTDQNLLTSVTDLPSNAVSPNRAKAT